MVYALIVPLRKSVFNSILSSMFILHLIIGYIAFSLAAFFSFFVPGNFFLSALQLKKTLSSFERHILSWFIGITLFICITYATAYIQLPDFYRIGIYALAILWLYLFIRRKKYKPLRWHINDTWSCGLILLGSVAFASLMFFSGFQTKDGLQFIGVNSVDGIRHLAYITDQVKNFPPQNPTITGETLRGFHYFYDFILSRFFLFYRFPVQDLYFRYFPFFISLLYGCSFIMMMNRMTSDKTARRFVLFLVYFSQSSTIFIFLFNRSIDLVYNALVQPMGLIVNPFTVLSIGMLFCGLSLLPLIKTSWKYALLIGLLLGVLSEIKVYTGIIGIGCIVTYCLYLLLCFKKKYLVSTFITLLTTAFITAVTFFPNNYGAGGLIFAPFANLRHYMESGLLASSHWELKRLIYIQHANWLRIILLYMQATGIFMLINFGIRLIFVVNLKQVFSKKFWHTESNIIIFTAMVISFFAGTFFLQSVSVFDTIQFFWLAIVITCIPAGITLAQIYNKIPYRYILVIVLLIITFPEVCVMEYQYLTPTTGITISPEDTSVLRKLQKIVPRNSFLTVLPPAPDTLEENSLLPQGTPFISALTRRQVYYEEGGLPSMDEDDSQLRENQLLILQSALVSCLPNKIRSILRQIGSPYVVVIGKYPCLVPTFKVIKKITSPHGAIAFYQFDLGL